MGTKKPPRRILEVWSGKRDSNTFSYVFVNQQIARKDNVIGCKIGVKITILQLLLEREFKCKNGKMRLNNRFENLDHFSRCDNERFPGKMLYVSCNQVGVLFAHLDLIENNVLGVGEGFVIDLGAVEV